MYVYAAGFAGYTAAVDVGRNGDPKQMDAGTK